MSNVVVMGECMVEFSPNGAGMLNQSFAGDVYNTAVYLKRLTVKATKVSILTAVGNDEISEKMLTSFSAENIDSSMIFINNKATVGAYLIETDELGERSFVYWRDSSAAKSIMQNTRLNVDLFCQSKTSIFYFSGISIAILNKEDREKFWQMITGLKAQGIQIVFDSNYRSRLWDDEQDAVEQFNLAFQVSDIVFAGVEDFFLLYQIGSFNAVSEFLKNYDINEVVIKNGSEGVISIDNGKESYSPVVPVDNIVDSTSAGDSFNGAYLAARIKGQGVLEAVKFASEVAALVIQHSGAIIDKKVFDELVKTND
jgi:2-dehydro-3-deoxygluconokinase